MVRVGAQLTKRQQPMTPTIIDGPIKAPARERRCGDELATLLQAAKVVQPPSAAKAAKTLRPSAGQWMSASVAVTRWVLG